MPQILDRGEGNAKRKERLARQKKGPGVFAYDGSGFDTEWIPTPRVTGDQEAVLGEDGMPALDGSGRQIFKPAGQFIRDKQGRLVMGGIPKVKRTPIEVFKLRGVSFPAGKEVVVDDPTMALKLRCMPCFEEREMGAIRVETEPDEEVVAPAHVPKKIRKKRISTAEVVS